MNFGESYDLVGHTLSALKGSSLDLLDDMAADGFNPDSFLPKEEEGDPVTTSPSENGSLNLIPAPIFKIERCLNKSSKVITHSLKVASSSRTI